MQRPPSMPGFEMSGFLHYFHEIGYLDLTPAGIKGYLAMLISLVGTRISFNPQGNFLKSHIQELYPNKNAASFSLVYENNLLVHRVICEFFEIVVNKLTRQIF